MRPPVSPGRKTKTETLLDHMRAGDWRKALRLASTFRMLGPHKRAIQMARECQVRPSFYRQLGRDPEATVASGIGALIALYGDRVR